MWRILLLAAALAAPGIAHAQGRFTSPLGVYSFTAPNGWTPHTDLGGAHVLYKAPGGAVLFSGSAEVTHSLGAEMTAEIGADALVERRAVTIDGMPCEFASAIEDGVMRTSMLLCHFYVPYSDGEARIGFNLVLLSPVARADRQLEIFWQVANSIKWGGAYAPAP